MQRRPYFPRGPLRALVLHHTARPAASLAAAKPAAEGAYVRRIQQAHMDRGFKDIGYHLVIMPSGRIFLGRPPGALGAHVTGFNTGTIGVALAGNFDWEEPTAAALRSLGLIRDRVARELGPLAMVGHRDLGTTRCPGRALYRLLDEVPRELRAQEGALQPRRWPGGHEADYGNPGSSPASAPDRHPPRTTEDEMDEREEEPEKESEKEEEQELDDLDLSTEEGHDASEEEGDDEDGWTRRAHPGFT